MSKGTPITPVRIPEGTRKEVEDFLARRESNDSIIPENMTEYIRAAIAEKLAKTRRSAYCPTRRRLRRDRQYVSDGGGI